METAQFRKRIWGNKPSATMVSPARVMLATNSIHKTLPLAPCWIRIRKNSSMTKAESTTERQYVVVLPWRKTAAASQQVNGKNRVRFPVAWLMANQNTPPASNSNPRSGGSVRITSMPATAAKTAPGQPASARQTTANRPSAMIGRHARGLDSGGSMAGRVIARSREESREPNCGVEKSVTVGQIPADQDWSPEGSGL
jgi:hypothetical protein